MLQGEHKTYDLKAVVVHTGMSIHCGHYTAYVQHDKEWFRIDDNQVRSLVAAYTYFCDYHKPVYIISCYILYVMQRFIKSISKKY